jgi:hypothetical protein
MVAEKLRQGVSEQWVEAYEVPEIVWGLRRVK